MRFSGVVQNWRVLRAPAFASLALMLLSGCSSDAVRLSDAFSNPFARGVDATPTGSATADAAQPKTGALRQPALVPQANVAAAPTRSPAVQSAALAAPAPAATAGISRVQGWSAEGGTPIVVAQGETAAMLATRYGVPEAEMLRLNGFNTAAQVAPGTRLVIPAYDAGVGRTAAAPAKTVAPAPAKHAAAPLKLAKVGKAAAPKPAKIAAAAAALAAAPKKDKLKKPVVAAVPGAAPVIPAVFAAPSAPVKKIKLDKQAGAPAPLKVAAAPVAPAAPAAPAKPEPLRTAALPKTAPAPAIDKTATGALPPAAPAATAEGNPEFRWPARGRIIQGFQGGNDGINIAVPEGTSVKAAEGGVVAYAGSELKGYGNLVLIKHPNGFVSAYANNGSLDVKRGDQVKRGQTIAKSGQSGNVSSPQLHFELRKGSTPVDPTGYLAGL